MKLPLEFYTGDNVLNISRSLLGKTLMANIGSVVTGGTIVEVEAYRGAMDRASHAYPNKVTSRTRTMFENGGRAYIYLCYGIHKLFNIVTNSVGNADAILIRAIEPTIGIDTMLARRKMKTKNQNLTSGPAKLCAAMGIELNHNGTDLLNGTIWIEDNANKVINEEIVETTRVGVDYAGSDAQLPWRFYIRGNVWVSEK